MQSAIDNSFNVVRNRIDKFGVVQPNIQKLEGQQGRIMVEMPGIREPERMRKLLQGSANLEFWETYNAEDIIPYLNQLDMRAANMGTSADSTAAVKDTVTTAQADTTKAKIKINKDNKVGAANNEAQLAEAKKQHPLLTFLQTTGSGSLSLVGYASVRDTAEINSIIY